MPTKKEAEAMEQAPASAEECSVEGLGSYLPTTYPFYGAKVAAKILRLREKVKDVTPSKMKAGRQSYNYLSEREMTLSIRPAMQELGLIAIPIETRSTTNSFDVGLDKDGHPRRVLLTEVGKTYRVVDTETGDFIDISAEGAGADPLDKGCNKATTGAFKNFLKDLIMCPSPERDDPDSTPSEGSSTTTSSYSGNSDVGSIKLKYGAHKGKTIRELFDENPEAVEALANGNAKWIADKAQEFLDSIG